MNVKIIIVYFTLILFLLSSCNSQSSDESSISSYSSEQEDSEESDSEIESEEANSDCKFEDGNYSATVNYNNSETGYAATYTLDVEVINCQVVQINFLNDGYLDEDHISYADIDEDGNASVTGENGKTYEVQIEN